MSEYKDLNDELELDKDLSEDLVDDLVETKVKDVAKEFGVKANISESKSEKAENVVSSPEPVIKKVPAIGNVNNAIGSTSAERKSAPKKAAKKSADKTEKVAVFSEKNVTWSGVGKVYRGYNILAKEEAEKWLTRDHVRPATPAEIAEEFGK